MTDWLPLGLEIIDMLSVNVLGFLNNYQEKKLLKYGEIMKYEKQPNK